MYKLLFETSQHKLIQKIAKYAITVMITNSQEKL